MKVHCAKVEKCLLILKKLAPYAMIITQLYSEQEITQVFNEINVIKVNTMTITI